tara:strand:- start:41 stop:826 length:786 start_codon:yes stop_codon:yes gene_type:complete
MSGFIQIHRKITEWEWYDDANTFRLFMHLLLKANYKAKSYRGMQLESGTVLTGRDLLANELSLSVRQIRTALDKLVATNEVTIETSPKGTKIQIVNYAKYQVATNETTNERPAIDQQTTSKRPTSDQQTTTNNKDNKENKEKKENKKEASFNFLKSIIDLGVEEQVAKDWMVVRKGKGANTLTAFKKIKEEIEACSATPNECITLSAQRGWVGFFAEYYKNSKVGSKQSEVSDDEKAFAENMGIIKGGTYIWKKFQKTKTW